MTGGSSAATVSRARFITLTVLAPFVVGCAAFDPEVGERSSTCVDDDSNPALAVDFVKEIRPRLNGLVPGTTGCKKCHDARSGTKEGFIATGLDLGTLTSLRNGGRSSGDRIVVPGRPCQSAIVRKLRGTAGTGVRMPKNGPFWSDSDTRLMMDWIAEGAIGTE